MPRKSSRATAPVPDGERRVTRRSVQAAATPEKTASRKSATPSPKPEIKSSGRGRKARKNTKEEDEEDIIREPEHAEAAGNGPKETKGKKGKVNSRSRVRGAKEEKDDKEIEEDNEKDQSEINEDTVKVETPKEPAAQKSRGRKSESKVRKPSPKAKSPKVMPAETPTRRSGRGRSSATTVSDQSEEGKNVEDSIEDKPVTPKKRKREDDEDQQVEKRKKVEEAKQEEEATQEHKPDEPIKEVKLVKEDEAKEKDGSMEDQSKEEEQPMEEDQIAEEKSEDTQLIDKLVSSKAIEEQKFSSDGNDTKHIKEIDMETKETESSSAPEENKEEEPDVSEYVIIRKEDIPDADSLAVTEALPKELPLKEDSNKETSYADKAEGDAIATENTCRNSPPDTKVSENVSIRKVQAQPESQATSHQNLTTMPTSTQNESNDVSMEGIVTTSSEDLSSSDLRALSNKDEVSANISTEKESFSNAGACTEAYKMQPEVPAKLDALDTPPEPLLGLPTIPAQNGSDSENTNDNGTHLNDATKVCPNGPNSDISNTLNSTQEASTTVPDLLFHRKFIANKSFDNPIDMSQQFSVVSYNILADCHAPQEKYNWISPEHLSQEYRHKKLLQEIRYLDSDIFCLQEVGTDYYETSLKPTLKGLGYEGNYIKRVSENLNEGEATFYRTNRFSFVSSRGIALKDLAFKELKSSGPEGDKYEAIKEFVDRPSVFLITQLSCLNTGKVLTVGNIHVSWENLAKPDLQCIEVSSALNELAETASSDGSFIICGDFNSWPGSSVYQLTKEGYLNDQSMSELQGINNIRLKDGVVTSLVNLWWKGFQHTAANMKSAYFTVLGKEPISTRYPNSGSTKAVDFVWYSGNSLESCGVLETVEAEHITAGIPTSQLPSDHLSLKTDLYFK